ncbi:MAG: DUF3302 domain-containing protein [Salaquimonas sp.]|nr:DUF3302 domain-containing protein [Salaquimonas sp.]
MTLITGPLDVYDYITFAFLVVAVIAFFYVLVTIGGLPGKLAERRHHPHAESVKIVGWIGLFTVFPWIHALIWAYHDSLTIDVRTFLGREGDRLPSTEGGTAHASGEPSAEPVASASTEPGDIPGDIEAARD